MKVMEKNKFRDVQKFSTVKDIIYNSVKLYPNNIAFVTKVKCDDQKVEYINHTYTDLLNDINAFGTALFSLDLKSKRVCIVGKNRYEWSVAHLSNLFGGIVSVPLDKELQIAELEDSLTRSKADAIVFDEKHAADVMQIRQNGKTNIKEYICMDNLENYEEVKNFNNLLKLGYELIKNGNNEFIEYEPNPYEMSILLFTSGTTSKSKAVMLNQDGIATNICDMLMVEDFHSTDTNIAFLPFHHIFGSTGMLVMLACGIKTVFPDGLRYIKQNLVEYQVSLFIGVPLLVDKMYQSIEKEIEKQGKTKLINTATNVSNFLLKMHIDLRKVIFKQVIDQLGGKLRFIISGGAPLDKKTAKGFNDVGIHIVQGYGLTETSPVIAAENDYFQRPGSVGIPMRSVQTDIINKDSNGIGELIVKGPNVMMGYYENEEKTKEVLKDGWFHTGDLAYFDEDGFLYITGRKKDVIVLKNGKKVFPEELELLINKIPGVEESFVYGMPEPEKNDVKVSVEIVYNADEAVNIYGEKSEGELHSILWEKVKDINKTLPPYKYIKHMVLTKEPLIKTSTNKTKRNEELKKVLGL